MHLPLSTLISLAGAGGVLSHQLYFVHGEHLLNVPPLLLSAFLIYLGGIGAFTTAFQLEFWTSLALVTNLYLGYLTGLFSSIVIYRLFFHRLRSFPGPFAARLTQLYHSYSVRNLDQYRHLSRLHSQYGPIVRIGPSTLSIASPSVIETVHGTRSKCIKSAMYDIGQPLTTIQQMRDRATHDRRRRHGWDQAFGAKSLRSYESRLLKYGELLVKGVADSNGHAVNITERLSWYSFDVMGDLTFGHSFEGLATNETHFALRVIHESNKALGVLGPVPWLIRCMTQLPASMNPMRPLLDFSEQAVEERRKLSPPEPDIMSHLLEAEAKEKFFTDPVQQRELMTGESRLLIIAGSDTTATNLTYMMYYLAKDTRLQERLRAELKEYGINESGDVTVPAVADLPLLNACINETLRLHPPVPSMSMRDTPNQGLALKDDQGDVFIPGNVTMYTPLYSIQRSPAAFVNPDEFIPERWTTTPELIKDMSAFAPFLIGAYSCIGRHLAFMEMRTVIAKLMMRFEVALASGEDGSRLLFGSADNFTTTPGQLDVVFKDWRSCSK